MVIVYVFAGFLVALFALWVWSLCMIAGREMPNPEAKR